MKQQHEGGPAGRRRAGIEEVAERAGVSRQTVSRALNNQDRIAESTRKRVLQVARDLNYHPNTAARTLSMRRSRKLEVSVVLEKPTTETAVSARCMADAAESRGYTMVFSEMRPDQLRDAITSAGARAIEGMIIHAPGLTSDEDIRDLAHAYGLPLVRRDYAPDSSLPSVATDQVLVMQALVEHLLAYGHSRVAEITGPLGHAAAAKRQEILESTLRSAGAAPPVRAAGDYSIESGFHAAQRLVLSEETFTVIVAHNDHMALGSMHALQRAGLRVPDDISVIGIDDKPYAAYLNPPLTTVRQQFDVQDSRAVDVLIDLIDLDDETEPSQQQTLLVPELVRRASVKDLRAPAEP